MWHSLSILLFLDYTCVYHRKENIAVTESPIWRVYVILTEILCRIGPCIILVILNLLMIHGFRTSMQRKKKLVKKVNEEKTKKSKTKVKSKYSDKTGMNIYDRVDIFSEKFLTLNVYETVLMTFYFSNSWDKYYWL